MNASKWMLVAALAVPVLAACEDSTGPFDRDADEDRVASATFTQVDRFGLPAIATVFIPTSQKDAYNLAQPRNDVAEYTDEVVAVLMAFGQSSSAAAGLAGALLPDVQPIDVTQPSGFLNGRRLQDDVITAELGLIFGGNAALNDDHVDANDVPFLSTFPYLAAPHVQ
jgi:Domain of unknown function (DUF4331)